jgi:hypothetical protein
LALAGDSSNDLDNPYDVAIDSSGNAYVTYSLASNVWKVVSPSGTPVETQMLGNYEGTGDDDPYSVGLVPTGFGGGFAVGSDLVMFDNGIDTNPEEAVVVIDAASTGASQDYSILWRDSTTSDDFSLRGATSEYDGYAYWATTTLHSADLGGTTKYYMNRINGDGVAQRVFLDIDASLLAGSIDDTLEVNQIDGSVWTVLVMTDGSHVITRIDVANMADQGGNDYLASLTGELAIDYNVGVNSMAISPDGQYLALGAPDGQDMIYVYNLIPEPMTLVMLACGSLFLRNRKK